MGDSGHSVLGLLDLGDRDVAGVDGELVRGSIGFVLGELIDMDRPFLSVDLNDFSLASFTGTSQHNDLIVLSDGERSDSVLGSEGL